MEKILYTIPEVAQILLTNRNKVYRMINEGILGYVDVTGCKRIPKSEVERVTADVKFNSNNNG